MSYDAGFAAAIVNELTDSVIGARVERVRQPGKDTLVFMLRSARESSLRGESAQLLIDCGSSAPRVQLTASQTENPAVPPMLCMLLRKHLTGSKITSVTQQNFERAIEFAFETRDEMGFVTTKYLVAEIMGKCSNAVFLDSERKIISAVKPVDFTTSRVRQILPGIKYEAPPAQSGKRSPLDCTKDEFFTLYDENAQLSADKFIMNNFFGISPLIAREIAFRAQPGSPESLWREFSAMTDKIKNKDFTPCLVRDTDSNAIEYSFTEIFQYGKKGQLSVCGSFGELCDTFFSAKSRTESIKQRSADILHLLANAETRLKKKIGIHETDLAECAGKDESRIMGDLITANIYQLKRGMTEAELIDYSQPDLPVVTVKLDSKLTPSQNAQKFYKRYNKLKNAESIIRKQLDEARAELDYIDTVFDSLARAENESDLSEIRSELYQTGFASKMKNYGAQQRKKTSAPKPLEYKTSSGYRLLCGKNNAQNDYITHKLASKGDLWFHVKDIPGSHVVLFCDGEEPPERDFTEAAVVAAVNSKAKPGSGVEVLYTRVKNIKKPPASKPGYVTFSSNYTAYVTADAELAETLKVTPKK